MNIHVPTIPFSWNQERDARLIECYVAGMSYSEIGKELGTTRNSCIGRGYRLGLKNGLGLTPDQYAQMQERRLERKKQTSKIACKNRQTEAKHTRSRSRRLSLYQMTHDDSSIDEDKWRKENSKEIPFEKLVPGDNQCRHPYNLEGPYVYCGCDKFRYLNCEGVTVQSSWCEHHHNTNTEPARVFKPKARHYHGTNFAVRV